MKVVLSGGPCVGKSTLIRKLEERGFLVVHEQATEVISDNGPMPWDDHEAFQYEVLRRQQAKEASLQQAPLLFLDRGAFDGIPYRQVYGRSVPEFFGDLQPGMYDVCYLLDPLPWEADGLRYESSEFTAEINPMFARVYEECGIPVVRVPVMENAEARLQFILRSVGKALGKTLAPATVSQQNTLDRKERRWFPSIGSIGASIGSASADLVSAVA
jgi:predicted ATPase